MKKTFELHKIVIDVSEGPDGKLVMGNFWKQGVWLVTDDDGSEFSRKDDLIATSGDDADIQAIVGENASLQAQISRMNDIRTQLDEQAKQAKADADTAVAAANDASQKMAAERDAALAAQKVAEDKVAALRAALA